MTEAISGAAFSTARPVRRWLRWRTIAPYFYVAPTLLILGLFIYWPIISSFILSFQKWDFLLPTPRFVGLDNYTNLMSMEAFWNAARITLMFTLVSVPVRLALALFLATLLLKNDHFNRILRASFFVPVVVSSVAVSIIWGWMFNTEFGLLNSLLRFVGLGNVPWLTNVHMALWSVAIVDIWKQLGYDMILYLAGLQAIPPTLIDAARIDGAGRWKRFRTIIFPLLMPTTFFLLIVSVINSFQVFTIVNVMTEGGPANGTDVLVQMLYRVSFINFEIGLGSALAVVLFGILLVITLIKFLTIGSRVHYGYD